MKQRRVLIAPEAAADINEIYDWVSGKVAVPPESDTPVVRKLLAFRVRF